MIRRGYRLVRQTNHRPVGPLKHRCPARPCEARIGDRRPLCSMHWSLVPEAIQRRVWDARRRVTASGGDLAGDQEYIDACAAALAAVGPGGRA